MKKIVIIGAGYAGVLIAKKLAKKLKNPKDFEISLIDRNPFHTMLTELHEVAACRVEEDSIKISLKKVFAGRNVKLVTDTVTSVDYAAKNVSGENGSYAYDYLVVATGSKPAFFGVPGAEENAFTLWSCEDAVKLREHIMNVFRKAALETDKAERRKLLSFVTVGAGFTGVEMAGELAEYVPSLCHRFEIDPGDVSMYDVDMLDRCCTVFSPKLSQKVQNRLEKMGVKVLLKTNILSVGKDHIEYKTGETTGRIEAGTVVWTAGVTGSDIATGAGAALGAAGRGRIQTDAYLRAQNDQNVYIAGDNIFYVPEGEKDPVPQMVENAEACADTISHNMLTQITGSGEMEKYAPKFHGTMACIGGRYGVAYIGMPGKFFGLPSFLAMFTKHFINIIYFIKVLGWTKIFSYLNHEFFQVRGKRSFVGGHFSNRSATFFLVPLRMYLGAYWVYEGVKKILEGWLSSPKLTGSIGGANAYYDMLLNGGSSGAAGAVSAATGAADAVAAATGTAAAGAADAVAAATGAADAVAAATGAAAGAAADAVTAATGAVAGAAQSLGEVLANWNILWLFRVIFINSGEYALKIQVPFADWMMNTFVLPSDGMQLFMQIVIVLTEIAVGLCLMGGLFTTPAGAVSIALQLMFLTSTGLYMSSWWMLFAGVAMLFGAGRVFSLDYYVMPWLKQYWKKVKFVKKWYLYND